MLLMYFSLIDSLKISEHADKISKKLSGGTKRKVSHQNLSQLLVWKE